MAGLTDSATAKNGRRGGIPFRQFHNSRGSRVDLDIQDRAVNGETSGAKAMEFACSGKGFRARSRVLGRG